MGDTMVYLKAKAGGEKSMPEKREVLEDAEGAVPQGPFNFRGWLPPTGKAMASEAIEGDVWGAYVTLGRSASPERGMA